MCKNLDNQKNAIKKELARVIKRAFKASGMNQTQAASLTEMSRSRVSDLQNDKIDKFTIDCLVLALSRFGYKISIDIKEKNFKQD